MTLSAHRLPLLPLAALLGLAACDPPPDFAAARQPLAPGAYLAIKPLDQVAAAAGTPALTPADAAALQARAAGLQSRAAALPDTAIDTQTRARLDAAIAAGPP